MQQRVKAALGYLRFHRETLHLDPVLTQHVKLINETLQGGAQSGTSPITCDSEIEVDPDKQCFVEIIKSLAISFPSSDGI